jgi:hypothetical protein
MRARALVKSCGIDSAPVDISRFLAAANAELQYSDRLAPGTAGMTVPLGDRNLILINEHEAIERQRFTALHEIAHILLELPSRHDQDVDSAAMFSYVRRPQEEIVCDTFAAECLLPHGLLQQDLRDAVAGFEFISQLAEKYQASLACTASRVAFNAPFACAYALSQDGFVRFSNSSPTMRASRFFITPRIQVPAASITGQCLKAGLRAGSGQVAAQLWTSVDDFGDVDLMEEVRIGGTWGQALTLLWIEDGDLPDPRGERTTDDRAEGEPLLRELDGVLPWPGRGRRR